MIFGTFWIDGGLLTKLAEYTVLEVGHRSTKDSTTSFEIGTRYLGRTAEEHNVSVEIGRAAFFRFITT